MNTLIQTINPNSIHNAVMKKVSKKIQEAEKEFKEFANDRYNMYTDNCTKEFDNYKKDVEKKKTSLVDSIV